MFVVRKISKCTVFFMKNHCVPYDEFVMRNLLCSLCMAPVNDEIRRKLDEASALFETDFADLVFQN